MSVKPSTQKTAEPVPARKKSGKDIKPAIEYCCVVVTSCPAKN